MVCSPPGFSVHGIFQAKILEQVAIYSSRGIILTQGLNPSLLHLQVDSLPLSLGSPQKRERMHHFSSSCSHSVCVLPATWVALCPSCLPSIPSPGLSLAPLLLTSYYSYFPDSCLLYPLLTLQSPREERGFHHTHSHTFMCMCPPPPNLELGPVPDKPHAHTPDFPQARAHACILSPVRLIAAQWTIARQALCPWGFSSQEYWSGLPSPPPGDLPNPGIEPESPALAGGCFTTEPPGKPTEASRYFHRNHHPLPPGLNHPAIPHPPGCSPPWPVTSRLFDFCFLFSPDQLPHLHPNSCSLNPAVNHLSFLPASR